ncbi:hypothetical protein AVEN_253459-1 [Araneus ventricosus]|uniref:Uncharacterized protein n=1 Tax=Araneus ventricosus TaxID=182803 RepID=A0A4Y2SB34_ARAVE|nr:hypothetical protein AVEN_253459-1 [Araneus ventricosus]
MKETSITKSTFVHVFPSQSVAALPSQLLATDLIPSSCSAQYTPALSKPSPKIVKSRSSPTPTSVTNPSCLSSKNLQSSMVAQRKMSGRISSPI